VLIPGGKKEGIGHFAFVLGRKMENGIKNSQNIQKIYEVASFLAEIMQIFR